MTSVYGLIGKRLVHSFSAAYFNAKFDREGRDARYRLFPIDDIRDVFPLIEGNPELKGLNVTIPYKTQILPFLDGISPEAEAIGAVNTLCIRRADGRISLYGHNTDAPGFEKSLCEFVPETLKSALILGNGGAAKAVSHVLENLGFDFKIASRRPGNGRIISYEAIPGLIANSPLIVNATPLGMYPDTEKYPDIPYRLLDSGHFLFDLIYNPASTLFMEKGRARGSEVKNGTDMFGYQAEYAWKIWENFPG